MLHLLVAGGTCVKVAEATTVFACRWHTSCLQILWYYSSYCWWHMLDIDRIFGGMHIKDTVVSLPYIRRGKYCVIQTSLFVSSTCNWGIL